MMRKQSEPEPEIEVKNDIHIYTHMNIDRKIPHDEIEAPLALNDNNLRLDDEMVDRGYYNTETVEIGLKYIGDIMPIIEECDKHIRERKGKVRLRTDYTVHNLSLLNLVESVIIELSKQRYPIDPLKIEILLVLFEKFDIFKNKEKLMQRFHESKSLDKALFFFSVLQSYLFSIGKMLVVQQKHDYLINKAFEGELTLTPTQSYDSKYGYFSEMETLYF